MELVEQYFLPCFCHARWGGRGIRGSVAEGLELFRLA